MGSGAGTDGERRGLVRELVRVADRLEVAADVWGVVLDVLGYDLDIVGTFGQWFADAMAELRGLVDPDPDGGTDAGVGATADAARRLAVLLGLQAQAGAPAAAAEAVDLLEAAAGALARLTELESVGFRDEHGAAVVALERARVLRRSGRLDEVRDVAREVLDTTHAGFTHGQALAAYEMVAACLVGDGEPGSMDRLVDVVHTRALRVGYHSAYASHRALALLRLHAGDPVAATEQLELAVAVLEAHRDLTPFALTLELIATNHQLALLFEARAGSDPDSAGLEERALERWCAALGWIETVPAGWRFQESGPDVVPDPLASCFQDVYRGALRKAAALGRPLDALEVMERAKQSGLAGLLRSRRSAWDGGSALVKAGIIDEMARDELAFIEGTAESERRRRTREAAEAVLGERLARAYVPEPQTADDLLRRLGDRRTLSVVELAFVPGERLEVISVYADATGACDVRHSLIEDPAVLDVLGEMRAAAGDTRWHANWEALAQDLLPTRLHDDVAALGSLGEAAAPRDRTLVICPDGVLSSLPWAGLPSTGRHLVDVFDIATVPTIALLDGGTRTERWLGEAATACFVEYGRPIVPLEYSAERLALEPLLVNGSTTLAGLRTALDGDARLDLAYLAGHGSADGLDQRIVAVPPDHDLSAAHALEMRWPPVVVFATCHVGRMGLRAGAMPLGMAISCLVSGADAFVSAVHETRDRGSGEVLAGMVRRLADGMGPVAALACAQRAHPRGPEVPLAEWAMPLCVIAG